MAAAHKTTAAWCKSRARIPEIVRQNCLPKAAQKIVGFLIAKFLNGFLLKFPRIFSVSAY
jgi:hypothetical protein